MGLILGLSTSAGYDFTNLKSVILDAYSTSGNILLCPLMQIIYIGMLVYISQFLMNILFRIETAGVAALLQKATGILFSFTFQMQSDYLSPFKTDKP